MRVRLWRICTKLLVATASIAAILFLSVFSHFHYKAHVARQLMKDLQQLELGKSTTADVKLLVDRYHAVIWDPEESGGPCTPANCTYVFYVSTYPAPVHDAFLGRILEFLDDTSRWEGVKYLGLRGWYEGATVTIGNGTVRSYSAAVIVRAACHKLLSGGWSVENEFPPLGHHGERWPNPVSENLLIRWKSIISDESGEGIEADLRPPATAQERQAAFDVNMNCLTQMGNGCFLLSDIMPDAVRLQLQHGGPLGRTAHACRGLKDPDLN